MCDWADEIADLNIQMEVFLVGVSDINDPDVLQVDCIAGDGHVFGVNDYSRVTFDYIVSQIQGEYTVELQLINL